MKREGDNRTIYHDDDKKHLHYEKTKGRSNVVFKDNREISHREIEMLELVVFFGG
jgi:hypothetical protein